MQAINPNKNARYSGILNALRTISIREGYGRAWHGMPAVVAGAGPAHALYFACYEKLKWVLSEKKQSNVMATGKTILTFTRCSTNEVYNCLVMLLYIRLNLVQHQHQYHDAAELRCSWFLSDWPNYIRFLHYTIL